MKQKHDCADIGDNLRHDLDCASITAADKRVFKNNYKENDSLQPHKNTNEKMH